VSEDNKVNIVAVFSFTEFLDVILRTKTINIRNITSVGNGEYFIIRSLMFYVSHLILILLYNALNIGVKYEV
jgi:hypothetical protein